MIPRASCGAAAGWKTGRMCIRWLTVFLDFPAGSFDAGVAFWRAATGYGRSAARGADGEFATLVPPAGDAYLRVQRIRDGAGGCHLDLHVDAGAESLDAVARRAQASGALVRSSEPGLVVAASPGGFLFCLTRWHGESVVPPPLAAAASAAGADAGVSRLDTLCLDVPPGGFERELAFWSALTGQQAHPAPVPGYAFLEQQPGLPLRLLFQQRESAAPGDPTRGHVDLGCTDPGARDRHVALGARVTAARQYWTVLADPAGREYCLVGRDPK
jgi:Glyoxalase-like domain